MNKILKYNNGASVNVPSTATPGIISQGEIPQQTISPWVTVGGVADTISALLP